MEEPRISLTVDYVWEVSESPLLSYLWDPYREFLGIRTWDLEGEGSFSYEYEKLGWPLLTMEGWTEENRLSVVSHYYQRLNLITAKEKVAAHYQYLRGFYPGVFTREDLPFPLIVKTPLYRWTYPEFLLTWKQGYSMGKLHHNDGSSLTIDILDWVDSPEEAHGYLLARVGDY